jgi:lipopolysaccharide transport system ATP-binding protein
VSEPLISVERLGKQYRLQHQQREGYVALRDVLARQLSAPWRWLRQGGLAAPGTTEEFWALKDVSFDVQPGEVVGIIGRNGAGKSTLLKILSRITEPTTGRVTLGGRVASLLEVGTGFHPELSGRENIFLNAAILGMSRAETARKFDEIVAFAEVGQFLDTPVKRYSSGMYVRLAFAVAAHLEPEVLVVDEVLAVGDAAFQKKSLGKMREASRSGRTVLFVSHNMAAIANLTRRCVVLSGGRVSFDGEPAAAIARYLQAGSLAPRAVSGRGAHTTVVGARLLDSAGEPTGTYTPGLTLRLEVVFDTDGASRLSIEAFLLDAMGQKLALASLHQFHGVTLPTQAGRFRAVLELAPMWLASGSYTFDVTTSIVNANWDHYVERMIDFDVVGSNPGGQAWDFRHSLGYGSFAMPCQTDPRFVPEPRLD